MIALFVLAVALAMDAFAVSLVRGSADGHDVAGAIRLGTIFGVAQALMPLIGWSLGIAFTGVFERVDHWIAFGLLAVLGLRMLRQSFGGEETVDGKAGVPWLDLLVAAFATSVDAAAAGVTLPLLGVAIPVACLAIGVTTGVLCTAGYLIGARVSPNTGRWAEMLGGLVLIGLGTRILVTHLSS